MTPDNLSKDQFGRITTAEAGFTVHDPSSPAGLKYDRSADFAGTHVQREVPLDNLNTIQHYLDPAKVLNYLHNPSDEHPTITKIGRTHWVDDGHHRLAAEMLKGSKTMTMNVAEFK